MMCLICHISKKWGVCDSCHEQMNLHFQRTKTRDYLCSYEGAICSLIRSAKIDNQRTVVAYLQRLFVLHTMDLKLDVDAVMPAPSSFWGRIHGRLDVAYHLSMSLAQKRNLIFLKPPYRLGWHKTKRSQSRMRADDVRSDLSCYPQLRILVIDDVRTTGYTLGKVKSSIQALSVRTLALAGVPFGPNTENLCKNPYKKPSSYVDLEYGQNGCTSSS